MASRGNSLRHPFSTFQGNHGAPMPVLQSLLGHSTAKTTMVYTPSTARQPVNATGRAGIIVQSGIATDDSNKEFFADLIEKRTLVSLFDFANLEGFFPGIHRTHRHFCALTVTPRRNENPIGFAFYMTRTDHLRDDRRRFTLTPQDLAPLNPNTLVKLGIEVSHATVAKYMPRQPKPPSPTWRPFLSNHMKQPVSTDFFVVPTVSFRVLYVA